MNVYCFNISVAPNFQSNTFPNSRSAKMSQAFMVLCLLTGDTPPKAQVLSSGSSALTHHAPAITILHLS